MRNTNHFLDPRVRLATCVLLSCVTALLTHGAALLPMIACALALLAWERPAKSTLKQRLMAVNSCVLLLWLFTPWSTPGTPCFALGWFTVTNEGLRLALLVSIKANCIALFFITLLAPLDMATLAHALRAFHINKKLIFLLLFTERSFHMLAKEWNVLQESAKLRGFSASCTMHTYKTLAQLLGMLILRSMDHAKKAHEALLLRGFTGVLFATRRSSLRPYDISLALVLLLPACCALALECNVHLSL